MDYRVILPQRLPEQRPILLLVHRRSLAQLPRTPRVMEDILRPNFQLIPQRLPAPPIFPLFYPFPSAL